VSRRGDWMVTFTGRRFWPYDPRPEDIELRDIAHALSMLCHYGGHVREFFSVAQHCVLVAEHLPEHLKLEGLLHDAHEAYLGDVIRPVKRNIGSAYHAAATRLDEAIAEKFGLEKRTGEEAVFASGLVATVDSRVLATEARDFLLRDRRNWPTWEASLGPAYPEPLEAWPSARAETEFLEIAEGLLGDRQGKEVRQQ